MSMRHQAIQSNFPFTFTSDTETDKDFTSSEQAQQTTI